MCCGYGQQPTYQMVRKDLIVAAYERKTVGTSRISDSLAVHCNAKIFFAVEDSVQVWQIDSFGILQGNT